MKTLKILALVLAIYTQTDIFASHMDGGEITYKWISGKKFEITLKIYRDCRGIPFNSPALQIFSYQNSNKFVTTLSYTRTSIEDITPLCPDSTIIHCTPNTPVSFAGIEVHTFKSTVDFASSPFKIYVDSGICQIGIKAEQCCRSGLITTISPGAFYVESMMDICLSKFKNSSPQLKDITDLNIGCNQPFHYNFGGWDYIDFDSLKFELVAPMNAHNSFETFNSPLSAAIPMTPYCPPNPNVVNCKALPNTLPPRGFYFDPKNGDIVFTPVKCDEIGIICVKISEYRKDSAGTWQMIGFVIRDIQIIVKTMPNNYLHSNDILSSYKFKTRVKQCIDIKTYDTLFTGYKQNNKGNITSISLFDMPEGMTFEYTDSSAGNKTGRICWKVPDSLSNRIQGKAKIKFVPVTMEIRDNFCPTPYIKRKTINIWVLGPDSLGGVIVNTYDDKNRNFVLDPADTLKSTLLKFKNSKSFSYMKSDNNGKYSDSSLWTGNYIYGVLPHPYYSFTGKDTTVRVIMDSIHKLRLLIGQSPGIYGRIYQDANANCRYDIGEKTFEGYRIFTDSNKYTGISDAEGLYYINAPKGTYKIQCETLPSKYNVSCPGSKSISISTNGSSSYYNNDFGIIPSNNFNDLSVGVSLGRFRLDYSATVTYYCKNLGNTIRRNIQIKSPLPKYIGLTSNSVLVAYQGTTAVLQIDSLLPGETYTKKCDTYIQAIYYKTREKLQLSVTLDSISNLEDSIKLNNTASEFRIIDGSYSVNEKLISADTIFRPGDPFISYTIHFQNTGTDTATRVVVRDTINKQLLDVSKFTMNWSDFPCETIISDHVITFIFDNINLPDATNSPKNSMAGFNFTLGLKSNVTNEILVTNKAHVAFDYHSPVQTPLAIARIVSPHSINKILRSTMCRNEKNKIYYTSNVKLGTGNQLILELSDNTGSFSVPVILRNITTSNISDSIDFVFPGTLAAGNYKIRIRTTNPALTSIPAGGTIGFTPVQPPFFSISTNLNNNGICEKDTLKITCNNSSYQYKTMKNNFSLTLFTNNIFYKIPVNLNDKFKVISMDNTSFCKDTISIDPTIYPKPTVGIQVKGTKTVFCKNDVLTLLGSGAKYYQFTRNDTFISSKTIFDTVAANLPYTAKFRVIGESAEGCTNISNQLNLVTNALPDALITAVPNSVCPGDSLTIYYGDGSYYDVLRNDSILLAYSVLTNFRTIIHNKNDKFNIIVYNNKGCTKKSKDADLFIMIQPSKPVITQSGNTLSIDPSGISTFKWTLDGILISNMTGSSIPNAKSGVYKVVVSNSFGCHNSSDNFQFFNTGIPGINSLNFFGIFPNPANLTLTIQPDEGLEFGFELTDLSGKTVLSSDKNAGIIILDLENTEDGIYFLRLQSEGKGAQTVKVIIQH